jgi:16S rRNA (guanine527-N7)-methyltransferase
VVIAICLPGVDVTCVDAVAKKAAFVQQAAAQLALPNLHGLHARVESLTAPPFDVVTSRAFSSLADLVRLTTFHVKHSGAPSPSSPDNPGSQGRLGGLDGNGVWMAMKAKQAHEETATLQAQAPGVDVFHVEPLQVPGLDAERCLVWMRRHQ